MNSRRLDAIRQRCHTCGTHTQEASGRIAPKNAFTSPLPARQIKFCHKNSNKMIKRVTRRKSKMWFLSFRVFSSLTHTHTHTLTDGHTGRQTRTHDERSSYISHRDSHQRGGNRKKISFFFVITSPTSLLVTKETRNPPSVWVKHG